MIEAMDARLHEIATRAGATVDDVLAFLDSPAGRRLRAMLATGLIVSVPVVMRVTGLRRSALGRAIEVAGGATLSSSEIGSAANVPPRRTPHPHSVLGTSNPAGILRAGSRTPVIRG